MEGRVGRAGCGGQGGEGRVSRAGWGAQLRMQHAHVGWGQGQNAACRGGGRGRTHHAEWGRAKPRDVGRKGFNCAMISMPGRYVLGYSGTSSLGLLASSLWAFYIRVGVVVRARVQVTAMARVQVTAMARHHAPGMRMHGRRTRVAVDSVEVGSTGSVLLHTAIT